jgi:hypothetical protein
MTRKLAIACLAVAGCGTVGNTGVYSPNPNAPELASTQGSYEESAPPSNYSAPPPNSYKSSSDDGYARRTTPSTAPATVTSTPPGYGYPMDHHPSEPPVAEVPRPTERPGLATVFGETRTSRVHDVEFERAPGAPFSIASFFYNDRAGAEAMATPDLRRAGHIDDAMPMRGGVTVTVTDENGNPFDSFSLGGRVYVVGEVGRRYSLVFHNQTGRRYELVASVDGLDVIDGRPAATTKRGYLIDPYGSVTIDGFRRNHEEVAAFRFGAVADSYAARTSGDRNVGVIGVALFDEQGATPWSDEEIDRRRTAQPFADTRFAQPPM